MRRALLAAGPALLAGLWLPARALDKPVGPVLLTISGTLKQANRDGRALFDMAMLERLPQHSFTTQTPWYPAARKFTGPLLRDVLAAAGAQGQQIEAIALNDYRVSIPMDDAKRFPLIIARLMDDQPMSLRDKGPLFIVYHFDAEPVLRNSIYYSRSAWQLKALEVR